MPEHLATFRADDWQTWPGGGPDPAQEGYGVPLSEWYAMPHPVEREVFRGTAVPITREVVMVGIGDRPDLVAMHRHDDARKRWITARRAWLTEHVSADAAADFWLTETFGRRQTRQAFYRDATPPEPPRRGW